MTSSYFEGLAEDNDLAARGHWRDHRRDCQKVILRELSKIQIGDIVLETTSGEKLLLRRVARPNSEQKRILGPLNLQLPQRWSPDRLL